MTGLFRRQGTLRALQRRVRRKARGLVQQQHAVDAPARGTRARAGGMHQESGLRSAATASSISCDRRMPDSIESS